MQTLTSRALLAISLYRCWFNHAGCLDSYFRVYLKKLKKQYVGYTEEEKKCVREEAVEQ